MITKASFRRRRIISIILLFIIALNALAAGYSFIVDPSGKAIGISTDYIRHSPFDSFLIPGIVLFIANGLLGLVAAIVAIRKGRYYQDLIVLQGLILTAWIIVQIIMVRDFNWMHGTCLLIGYLLIRYGNRLRPLLSQ
jgi:hypothetical protein